MSKRLFSALCAIGLSAGPALAEPPQVTADILPVQSLVAMVTGDLVAPEVVVRPGASPHGYVLRPSEASALQDAGAVFWIGPQLTPWMADPLATLAGDAVGVSLLAVAGTVAFETRTDYVFGSEDGEDHDDGHAHGHDGHADDHTGDDPHLWLMPDNALLWLDEIAAVLSTLDPDNASTYSANAAAGRAEIAAAVVDATAVLAPVLDRPFVVYHDAYQYLEAAFGLNVAGSLALSDATPPSAARIAEIRDLVAEGGIICAFSEPQFDPGLIESVFGTGGPVRVAVLDPLGAEIAPGAGHYPALIRQLADRIAGCLS